MYFVDLLFAIASIAPLYCRTRAVNLSVKAVEDFSEHP